ncbi:hypothetical protein GCM10009765_21560 [Fodinicola feengrottensis]|uniref:N-acetyltransferase domain-containing protein n=1 Tax=Fodinicola feengrottensis TaxID=435914 RepID=A0ABN2GIK7_9ACTN
MINVREIEAGQTKLAAETMLALRPRWQTADAVVAVIDTHLRPEGYRLVGAFEQERENALSIMGFRELWSSAWGHHLYVDDLFTLPEARRRGHADLLMEWVRDVARSLGCEAINLDSGVSADRAPAHRLYMRHRMVITAHHFTATV